MGTDICSVLEKYQDSRWQFTTCGGPDDRDYDWFSMLAGVRNYASIKPIAPLRGIPLDADPATGAYLTDAGVYHSFSHVGLDEMVRYIDENFLATCWERVSANECPSDWLVECRRNILACKENKRPYLGYQEIFHVGPIFLNHSQGTSGFLYGYRHLLESCIRNVWSLCKDAEELIGLPRELWATDYDAALEQAKNLRLVFGFDN